MSKLRVALCSSALLTSHAQATVQSTPVLQKQHLCLLSGKAADSVNIANKLSVRECHMQALTRASNRLKLSLETGNNVPSNSQIVYNHCQCQTEVL